MRLLLSIMALQMRLYMKNKTSLLVMIGLPIAFTGLFGVLMGGGGGDGPSHVPVAIVDQDGSPASRRVIELLEQDQDIRIVSTVDGDMDRLFNDRRIEAGAIIPAGFARRIADGEAPELILVKAPAGNMQVAVQPSFARAAAVVAQNYTLAHLMDPANPEQAYTQIDQERQAVQIGVVATKAVVNAREGSSQLEDAALGMTVMFMMMVLVSMGGVVLQERATGTWGRLLTTPVNRFQVLTGYLLAFFLIGMIQLSVLVVTTSLLYGISWGPLPQLALVAAALSFCSVGLGLFIASIAKSYEQHQVAASAVVLITSFLGGVFWPLDVVGKTMQMVGRLIPQAWAMDALRAVMFRGGAWDQLLLPLAVLCGMTVLFMGIGLARVRFE